MKSIRFKLVLSFLLLVVFAVGIVGVVSIVSSRSAMNEQLTQSIMDMAEGSAKLTESRLETQMRTLQITASSNAVRKMSWNVQKDTLAIILKENSDFLALAVVDLEGQARYTDGTTADLSDREYVQKALEGSANVSDVLISSVTGEPVIMIAVPITYNGEIVGALIGRRDGNTISDIVADIGYGESGYSYIINGEGIVVAHPDKEKVLAQFSPITEVENDPTLQSTADLFEKILAEKNGVTTYSYNGQSLYAAYTAIEGTDWYYVVTATESELNEGMVSLQRLIFIAVIIIIMIGIVSGYLIGTSIAKPITKMSKQALRIASLDISEDIPKKLVDKKDETGILSQALQSITENLRSIIVEINDSSQHLSASSEELTATSEQTSITAEEVMTTILEVAKGATNQAELTQEGTFKANALGDAIENDQQHLNQMNGASEKAAIVIKESMVDMQNLFEKTKENNQASSNVFQLIMKTDESSQKISEASGVIASIAEQTNLLALNAAIEAARAGEAGRGFSVVAEEIRRLAEQSALSTEEIDRTVAELLGNSKEAVNTIKKMSQVLEEQTASVNKSQTNYEEIQTAINNALEAVGFLNESGKQMERVKIDIIDTMQNLSAIAEENSASTQEVTASMEEQAASVKEVAQSSEELAKLAEKLQDIISKFKM